MNSADERHSFSERLRRALNEAGWRAIGATSLAREFNARSDGTPITAHAARKWLHGEAMPTQDNLQALARWLEVLPHWLRFGDSAIPTTGEGRPNLRVLESKAPAYRPERGKKLAEDFARLTPEQQVVVEELVALLLKKQQGD